MSIKISVGIRLVILVTLTVVLAQRVHSTFGPMPAQIRAIVHHSVELSCPVNGFGFGQTYYWYKYNGGQLQLISRGSWINDMENMGRMEAEVGSQFAQRRVMYNLTISRVTNQDSGTYVCKMSDRAGTHSSPNVELTVESGTLRVMGAQFVEVDSPLSLTCDMPRGPNDPDMNWFKDGALVETTANNRTIVRRFPGTGQNARPGISISISRAQMSDTGQYICRGFYGPQPLLDSIVVHVLRAGRNIRRGHSG